MRRIMAAAAVVLGLAALNAPVAAQEPSAVRQTEPATVAPDRALLLERYESEPEVGHFAPRRRVLVLDVDGSLRQLVDREAMLPSWSPDGDQVVYLSGDGVHVVARDGSGDRVLLPSGLLRRWSWSPNGDAILAVHYGDTGAQGVVIVDPVTGSTRSLDGVSLEFTVNQWSPDGSQIAYREGDAEGGFNMWVIGTDGGARRQVTSGINAVGAFAWAPDGTRIGFIARMPDSTIAVAIVDTGSGEVQVFENTAAAGYSLAWSPDGTRIAYNACLDECASPDAVVRVGILDPSGATEPIYVAPDSALHGWVAPDRLVVTHGDYGGSTVGSVDLGAGTVVDWLTLTEGRIEGVAIDPGPPRPPLPATAAAALWWSRDLPDGNAPTVLLGRSDAFADSLSSGGAQGVLDAPLLLTPPDRLDDAVANELARLGATRVIVLGGTAAISEAVTQDLRDRGYIVERLAGATRIDTAIAVAETVVPEPRRVLLARAFGDAEDPTRGYADALGAGAAAAGLGDPLLLTDTGTLSPQVAAYLDRTPSVGEVVIVGGTEAVSAQVEEALLARDVPVVRVAGDDRFQTAALLSAFAAEVDGDDAAPPPEPGTFVVLDGEDPAAWGVGFAAARLADPTGSGGVLLAGANLQPLHGRLLTALDGSQLRCGPTLSVPVCYDAGRVLSVATEGDTLVARIVDGDTIAELFFEETPGMFCGSARVEGATLVAASIGSLHLPTPGYAGASVLCLRRSMGATGDPGEGATARVELDDGRVLQAPLERVS